MSTNTSEGLALPTLKPKPYPALPYLPQILMGAGPLKRRERFILGCGLALGIGVTLVPAVRGLCCRKSYRKLTFLNYA